MVEIFNDDFNGDACLFAEAVINGYDWGDNDAPFSLDFDVAHVFVDSSGNLVCVHMWDMEEYCMENDMN
jgi:hypothetical protein